MNNKKLLLVTLLASVLALPAESITLSEITHPKDPAYRVGLSALPEQIYVKIEDESNNFELIHSVMEKQNANLSEVTYADLSIKQLSREVAQDLAFDEQDMVADLSLLWQGAAKQSDTINFALYKLSNPDADKPDSNSVKKVLSTIAGMSTLVGAGISNPVMAGSSLIGSNVLSIFSQDTKALNYKYTKVGDADMIILVRKVEDLQQKAVNLYYDYISAKKQLDYINKLVQDRQDKFELAQKNNASRELILITDAYYRTALDKQRSAKSDFFSKRAALEQFVGNETFVQFENELVARENQREQEKISEEQNTTEVDTAYINTIRTVEDYTKQYNNSVANKNEDSAEHDSTPYQYENVTEKEIKNPFLNNGATLRGLDEYLEEDTSLNQDASVKIALAKTTKAKKGSKTETSAPAPKTTKKKEAKTSSSKPSKVKAEKPQTPQNQTPPKKKGVNDKLIFIHNTPVKNQPQGTQPVQYQEQNTYYQAPQVSPQTQMNNMYNLAPLDEIRIPELHKGGYSIHSEGY